MLDWGLLALVILVLVLVFLRQQRVVQGQAELAAIKTTVGALRVALVFEQLRAQMGNGQSAVAAAQRNPFLFLQQPPINYQGEMIAARAAAAPPGSWIYDPECGCVAYLPLDPHWLSSPSGATSVWYRVVTEAGVPRLVAMEAYAWQGQDLK